MVSFGKGPKRGDMLDKQIGLVYFRPSIFQVINDRPAYFPVSGRDKDSLVLGLGENQLFLFPMKVIESQSFNIGAA